MTNNDQTRQQSGHGLSMRNAARLFLLVSTIFLFSESGFCAATEVYIAQSAAGAANGTSCANARAASYFNSSGNWGSGATQIGPGTTVRLCGTISTSLTFQGSGTAAAPIVLDGTGSTTSGGFTMGQNFITLQNTTSPEGGGVFIPQGGGGSSLPHDILIRGNYFRNQASNSGGDIITTEGSYNVIIEGNYFENRATNNDSHVDCIQTWEKGGGSSGPPRDWTIRYNWLVINTPSQNNKSFHMLESLTGQVNIYGNVYIGQRGAGAANGINMNSNQSGMVANIYGNTFIQRSGGNNNTMNLKGNGQWNLRNNVVYSTDAANSLLGDAVGTSRLTRDHNLWFGPGSPSCTSTEICNRNPNFTNLAGNDFSLQASSPAVGTGASLGAPYNRTPIQGATWPNPTLGTRPAGAWDMGAFVNSSATTTAPAPPTCLVVVVQ